MLIGTILTGFGIFNLLKGFIDHQLLGIHHVNEIVPPGQWTFWEMGFLLGETAPLLAGGWLLWQAESARLSRRPLERYNSFSSCSL